MERAIVEEGVGSTLRDAVARLHGARAETGKGAPREAGRWTTLFELEVDGCHYRLIREGQRGLTPRERDVVERVLRGSSNKVIAYDLGIAHATVRVLLHRVMLKLGVQSRRELELRLRAPTGVKEAPQQEGIRRREREGSADEPCTEEKAVNGG
ncbi:MAG TPA: helix-turn-helix transcriptional regulator [Polyangiaceae bacterium]